MRIVTFDGKYEVVTDETPQGCYALLLPADEWLGNGFILDSYPSAAEAHTALRHLVETYAHLTLQGFTLEQAPVGLCFVHPDGRVHPLGFEDRRTEQKEA